MKAKINLKNIAAYLVGNYRYVLYYNSNFQWLIRPHIKEQIDIRINSMDQECYNEGQCKMCGCDTTALQMANKACDKPCYPKMVNKKSWERFKHLNFLITDSIGWTIKEGKFKELIII